MPKDINLNDVLETNFDTTEFDLERTREIVLINQMKYLE